MTQWIFSNEGRPFPDAASARVRQSELSRELGPVVRLDVMPHPVGGYGIACLALDELPDGTNSPASTSPNALGATTGSHGTRLSYSSLCGTHLEQTWLDRCTEVGTLRLISGGSDPDLLLEHVSAPRRLQSEIERRMRLSRVAGPPEIEPDRGADC